LDTSIGLILGLLLGAMSGAWLLIMAFRKHAWWGVGCLLAPLLGTVIYIYTFLDNPWRAPTSVLIVLVPVVFAIMNFRQAWLALALNIIAGSIVITSALSLLPGQQPLATLTSNLEALETREQYVAELTRMTKAMLDGRPYQPRDTAAEQEHARRLEKEQQAVTRQSQEEAEKASRESHQRARERWNKQWEERRRSTRVVKELAWVKTPLREAGNHVDAKVRITLKTGQPREGTLLAMAGDKLVVGKNSPGGLFSYEIKRDDVEELEVEMWVVQQP